MQENIKQQESLQEKADTLYIEAQAKLKKLKRVKRIKQVILALCALSVLTHPQMEEINRPVTIFGMIVSMAAFLSIDYKRQKEQLEHEALSQLKIEELTPSVLKLKEKEELEEESQILDAISDAQNQRTTEAFVCLGSLGALGVSVSLDKLTWPTACLSMTLIFLASSYWEKGNYQAVNAQLKNNLSQKIKLKNLNEREKERE